MKYGLFDKKGLPKAFYDSEIHGKIPKKAVKLTDEQWKEFIDNKDLKKWDHQTKVPVTTTIAIRGLQIHPTG